MASLSKGFSLLIILILAVSSIIVVKTAFAQTTQTPSVPQFTVKYVDSDIPAIVVTINNQQFIPYPKTVNRTEYWIHLYYDVRAKGHNEENWTNTFNLFYYGYVAQSEGLSTVLYFAYQGNGYYFLHNQPHIFFNYSIYATSDQMDFQVQAMIGYFRLSDNVSISLFVFEGQTSKWSNTQTVTIPNASYTPITATPTPTPTIPEFSSLAIQITLITMVAVAGLLVYFKKRRQTI
jgi:hypothetical protein